MMEYYKQTKEAALRALGSVLHQPVEDDHEAVHSALAAAALTGGFAAVPTITFEKFGLKLTFKQGDADAYLAALGAA